MPDDPIGPAIGDSALLLDYYIAEVVDDRLLCAAVSADFHEQFEAAIATRSDTAPRGALDALLEANSHWVPAADRLAELRADMADLDAPGAVGRARGLLQTSHHRELPRDVHPDLDEILLGPVRDRLAGFDRLVIVPYNYLHNFPFHALPSLLRLADQDSLKEIVYEPSVRMALALREPRRHGSELRRCLFVGSADQSDLPIDEELAIVERHFEQVTALVGRHATCERLAAALADCDVLHICAHGRADTRSGAVDIQLHAGDHFSARDLLAVPAFGPSLLVANTCFSGVAGRTSRNGDALPSLPTAALIRGAQNVVATLWKTRNDTAIRFAELFYEALRSSDSVTPARAAQVAQKELRRGAAELATWAPHVVFGGGP